MARLASYGNTVLTTECREIPGAGRRWGSHRWGRAYSQASHDAKNTNESCTTLRKKIQACLSHTVACRTRNGGVRVCSGLRRGGGSAVVCGPKACSMRVRRWVHAHVYWGSLRGARRAQRRAVFIWCACIRARMRAVSGTGRGRIGGTAPGLRVQHS